jgi:putative transcriptional regulator
MSKLGKRMIASARKTRLRLEAGEPLKLHVPIDVKKLRNDLGLTQEDFAARYGIPTATLREWEQRRRVPDAATRSYLLVIARSPDMVRRSLARQPVERELQPA